MGAFWLATQEMKSVRFALSSGESLHCVDMRALAPAALSCQSVTFGSGFYSHKEKGSRNRRWSCVWFSASSNKQGLAYCVATKTCIIVVRSEKTTTKMGLLSWALCCQNLRNLAHNVILFDTPKYIITPRAGVPVVSSKTYNTILKNHGFSIFLMLQSGQDDPWRTVFLIK